MKSYKHKVLINTVRVISIIFVLLMSLGFIKIMSCSEFDGEHTLTEEEINLQYKLTYTDFFFNLYQRSSYMFYPFVFLLGAFWSRKKIIKTGIL